MRCLQGTVHITMYDHGHGKWSVLSEQSAGHCSSHKEEGQESALGRGPSTSKDNLEGLNSGHGFSPLEKVRVSLVQGFLTSHL